jgi:hypothetical protein
MTVKARSSLVAGGLAALLAFAGVACEVDDVEMDDPLEDNDLDDDFEDDLED